MPRPKKQRPTAPTATVQVVLTDKATEIAQNALKALGDAAKGMSPYYGDPLKAEKGLYEREGYIAVKDPETGKQVYHGLDPLFMRPEGLLKAQQRESGMLARQIVDRAFSGEDAEGTRDDTGKVHRPFRPPE